MSRSEKRPIPNVEKRPSLRQLTLKMHTEEEKSVENDRMSSPDTDNDNYTVSEHDLELDSNESKPHSSRAAANYLQKFSNEYRLKWKEFSYKFKSLNLPKKDFEKLREAYRKRRQRQSENKQKPPHISELSHVLKRNLPAGQKSTLTNILDNYLPYQEKLKLVKSHIQSKTSHSKNIVTDQGLRLMLEDINVCSRLKAGLYIGQSVTKIVTNRDSGTNLSYFHKIIVPLLNSDALLEYIEPKEARFLLEISKDYNLSNLNDSAALVYCEILGSHNIFSISEAWNQMRNKDIEFWKKILCKVFKLSKECFDLWWQHPGQLIRNEVLQHHIKYGVDEFFCSILIKLSNTLTESELLKLYLMISKPNFKTLMELVPSSGSYSFNSLETSFSYYLDNSNRDFVNIMRQTLKEKPLQDWSKYYNSISNFDLSTETALKEVEAVFKLECKWETQKFSASSKVSTQILKDSYTTLNEKFPLANIPWQKFLVANLLDLLIKQKRNYLLVQIGTGHGKSIIIQLLALSLLQEFKKDVYIVCLSDYLACQSRMKYNNQLRIKYKSIEEFMLIPPSSKQVVIFDEIDQMLGTQSFIVDEIVQSNPKVWEATYLPAHFAKWGGIIAFSGTLSEQYISQFKTDFPKALTFKFPSFRMNSQCQEIKKIVKSTKDINTSLLLEVHIARKDFKNVIIIFETAQKLLSFESKLEEEKSLPFNYHSFIDFSKNHGLILTKLDQLLQDNWVALITREGSRGTDFKGRSPSHVILTYQPSSYSECIQALGRGARSLDQGSSGTVICENPFTLEPKMYLRALQAMEEEVQEALLLNIKVAQRLHGFQTKIQKERESLEFFSLVLRQNENFRAKKDSQLLELWIRLSNLVGGDRFPKSPFHSDSAFVTPNLSQECD